MPKPASDLIEAFRGAPTSVISDNLARLPGAVGLRPFHRGSKLVGIAFTVRHDDGHARRERRPGVAVGRDGDRHVLVRANADSRARSPHAPSISQETSPKIVIKQIARTRG